MDHASQEGQRNPRPDAGSQGSDPLAQQVHVEVEGSQQEDKGEEKPAYPIHVGQPPASR